MLKKIFYSVILISLFSANLSAQDNSDEDQTQDHISADRIGSFYSILPIAGYSSDWGVYGGGYLQRINYGVNVEPFLSRLKTDFTVSTRGYFITQFEYERTETFGTDIRSSIDMLGQRIIQGQYFGIGNDTEFSKSLFDDGFNFYENREFYLKYMGRKSVGTFGTNGKIDLFATASYWWVDGRARGEESLFSNEQPIGFQKSSIGKIGMGLLLDSRDNEFSPGRGIYYEAGFNVAPALLGFDFSFSEAMLDLRNYVSLSGNVVLAHRVKLEHTMGDTPFWAMPVLGNEEGLRGFYLNRFRGTSSVLSMTEIRMWLFSVLDDQIRVGTQFFWDSGRVFSDFDSNGFFDEWKQTIGFGVVFTLLHPDFILRSDFGFSNESFRFYFGSSYVF